MHTAATRFVNSGRQSLRRCSASLDKGRDVMALKAQPKEFAFGPGL